MSDSMSAYFPDRMSERRSECMLYNSCHVEGSHEVKAGPLLLEAAGSTAGGAKGVAQRIAGHLQVPLRPTAKDITLWLFNIAMEHGPFIDDFPS